MIDGLGVAQEGKRRNQSPGTDSGHDIEFRFSERMLRRDLLPPFEDPGSEGAVIATT